MTCFEGVMDTNGFRRFEFIRLWLATRVRERSWKRLVHVGFGVDNINSRQQALANSNPRRGRRAPVAHVRPIETCLHTNSPRKRPAAWP